MIKVLFSTIGDPRKQKKFYFMQSEPPESGKSTVLDKSEPSESAKSFIFSNPRPRKLDNNVGNEKKEVRKRKIKL